MAMSYSRRSGDYLYDIYVREMRAQLSYFCAQVLNTVRLESGNPVTVHPYVPDAYAVTPDGAVEQLEATIKQWVQDQTPPS